MGSLEGKSAVVIGGSSGIGLAIAQGLCEAGANLALSARTEAKLNSAADAMRPKGGDVLTFPCDINEPDASANLMDRVVSERGRLDILVNSQGTTILKPVAEFSPTDYDTVMNTNLRSLFFACQAAHRHMAPRGSGTIINIASLAAHRGWSRATAYALSKHGVLALTRSLAAEWASDGIRVNSISPGFFMTDLNRERMTEERKQTAIARTPMKRFGQVEELAGAAVYLAGESAGFVTGTDIAVDGGYLAAGI